MSKFCTSCGASLDIGAKFCAVCGNVIPENISTKTAPALVTVSELSLPLELTPFASPDKESLFLVLKSGFKNLASGFKRTLGSKKRLITVIILTVIWLLVNILASLDIFPPFIKTLSWLTAARGSIVGGTIGKGIFAAFIVQLIAGKGFLKNLKGGVGQFSALFKGEKGTLHPMIIGAGASLIASNLIISSTLQNSIVMIAGFALSAQALVNNGFLRRFFSALLPKMHSKGISSLMQGWTVGFLVFIAVSVIPGIYNGYIAGAILLIVKIILSFTGKKEAAL